MFPNRAKLLNEPYNQLGAITAKLFFPKPFSHFSKALKMLKTVLRKTWKALRIDTRCNMWLSYSERFL